MKSRTDGRCPVMTHKRGEPSVLLPATTEKQVCHCHAPADRCILLCKFMDNLLIEHVEGEILAHVKERISSRARASCVHQIHQRALLRRKRHALVPHLRVSEMCHQ